jgi:hypothetical protein
VEKIEGRKVGPPKEIILKPELIIRRTCGFNRMGYKREGLEQRNELSMESRPTRGKASA